LCQRLLYQEAQKRTQLFGLAKSRARQDKVELFSDCPSARYKRFRASHFGVPSLQ
jgi:hypothetical protein